MHFERLLVLDLFLVDIVNVAEGVGHARVAVDIDAGPDCERFRVHLCRNGRASLSRVPVAGAG